MLNRLKLKNRQIGFDLISTFWFYYCGRKIMMKIKMNFKMTMIDDLMHQSKSESSPLALIQI